MTKKVIPVGDGRLIEMEEGELKAPPSPPKTTGKGKQAGKRKKAATDHNKPQGKFARPDLKTDNPTHRKSREIPGYHEWWKERCRQIQQFFNKPGGPVRRRFGVPDGMRREDAEVIWAEARRKAKIDMANIKKVQPDMDERAEEALLSTLEVMRSPMNQTVQLAAARQVLEWTKAKPATKSEMTVNAAEAWLASIADEADKS